MDWIVQELNPKEDERLVKEIEKQGDTVHFWKLKDLLTYCWGSEEEESIERLRKLPKPFNGAIHTSCLMLEYLTPYIRHLTPMKELRCQKYYSYWYEYLANSDFRFVTLGTLKKDLERFGFDTERLQWRHAKDCFFLRPDTNDKIFSGQLIQEEKEIDNLLYALPPETLCVQAPPQRFLAEWRLIVCNGKVVSGSLYRQDGYHNELEEGVYRHLDPKDFAEEIASKPYPGLPSIYAMDVALLENGEFGLLEIGGINCCGFYSCDLEPVVKAIAEETNLLCQEDDIYV